MRKVQRKPPIFSLAHEAYTDSDDDYIEMQAYNSKQLHRWLAGVQPSLLFVRFNSAFSPPSLSPLTRHHLSRLPPLECKYWKTLTAPAGPDNYQE